MKTNKWSMKQNLISRKRSQIFDSQSPPPQGEWPILSLTRDTGDIHRSWRWLSWVGISSVLLARKRKTWEVGNTKLCWRFFVARRFMFGFQKHDKCLMSRGKTQESVALYFFFLEQGMWFLDVSCVNETTLFSARYLGSCVFLQNHRFSTGTI